MQLPIIEGQLLHTHRKRWRGDASKQWPASTAVAAHRWWCWTRCLLPIHMLHDDDADVLALEWDRARARV